MSAPGAITLRIDTDEGPKTVQFDRQPTDADIDEIAGQYRKAMPLAAVKVPKEVSPIDAARAQMRATVLKFGSGSHQAALARQQFTRQVAKIGGIKPAPDGQPTIGGEPAPASLAIQAKGALKSDQANQVHLAANPEEGKDTITQGLNEVGANAGEVAGSAANFINENFIHAPVTVPQFNDQGKAQEVAVNPPRTAEQDIIGKNVSGFNPVSAAFGAANLAIGLATDPAKTIYENTRPIYVLGGVEPGSFDDAVTGAFLIGGLALGGAHGLDELKAKFPKAEPVTLLTNAEDVLSKQPQTPEVTQQRVAIKSFIDRVHEANKERSNAVQVKGAIGVPGKPEALSSQEIRGGNPEGSVQEPAQARQQETIQKEQINGNQQALNDLGNERGNVQNGSIQNGNEGLNPTIVQDAQNEHPAPNPNGQGGQNPAAGGVPEIGVPKPNEGSGPEAERGNVTERAFMSGANQEANAFRREIGLDNLSPVERKRWGQIFQEALDSGLNKDTRRIIDDVFSGKPISEHEQAGLALRLWEIKKQYRALIDEQVKAGGNEDALSQIEDAKQGLQAEADRITTANKKAGTKSSLTLGIRGVGLGDEMDIVSLRARDAAEVGKPIDAKTQKKYDQLAADHQRVLDQMDKLQAERDQLAQDAQKVGRKRAVTLKGSLDPAKAKLEAEAHWKTLEKQLLGGMKSKQSGAVRVPVSKMGTLAKIVEAEIKGGSDLDTAIDKVVKEAKERLDEDIDPKELTAEFGGYKKPPLGQRIADVNGVRAKLRLAKREAYLQSKLDDFEQGTYEKATKPNPITNARITSLETQIAELSKQANKPQKLIERQAKLQKTLDDLKTGNAPAPRAKAETTPQIDAIKKELAQVRKEAGIPVREARNLSRVKSDIADLESQLRTGVMKPPKVRTLPEVSAELARLRSKRSQIQGAARGVLDQRKLTTIQKLATKAAALSTELKLWNPQARAIDVASNTIQLAESALGGPADRALAARILKKKGIENVTARMSPEMKVEVASRLKVESERDWTEHGGEYAAKSGLEGPGGKLAGWLDEPYRVRHAMTWIGERAQYIADKMGIKPEDYGELVDQLRDPDEPGPIPQGEAFKIRDEADQYAHGMVFTKANLLGDSINSVGKVINNSDLPPTAKAGAAYALRISTQFAKVLWNIVDVTGQYTNPGWAAVRYAIEKGKIGKGKSIGDPVIARRAAQIARRGGVGAAVTLYGYFSYNEEKDTDPEKSILSKVFLPELVETIDKNGRNTGKVSFQNEGLLAQVGGVVSSFIIGRRIAQIVHRVPKSQQAALFTRLMTAPLTDNPIIGNASNLIGGLQGDPSSGNKLESAGVGLYYPGGLSALARDQMQAQGVYGRRKEGLKGEYKSRVPGLQSQLPAKGLPYKGHGDLQGDMQPDLKGDLKGDIPAGG